MKPIPEDVRRYIEEARVCRIATVRPSGEPHVIPVCPAFDGGSTLYVDIGTSGLSSAAVSGNPRVTALIDDYDDDWSRLKAVILRCRAEIAAGSELDDAWRLIREKFPQGEAIGWSARTTLALRVQDWSEWGITRTLGYDSG